VIFERTESAGSSVSISASVVESSPGVVKQHFERLISFSPGVVELMRGTSNSSSTPVRMSSSSPRNRPQYLVPFGPSGERWGQIFDLGSGVSTTLLQDLRADFGLNPEPGLSRKRQYTEIQLLSLTKLDPHIRIHLGGLVMAKSVKFLGKLETTQSDQETRESWWEELREDIRKHAKTLCCTHVVGYSETCTIYKEVCVLSAVGTAAVLKADPHPSILMQILDSLGEEIEDVPQDENVHRKLSVGSDGGPSKVTVVTGQGVETVSETLIVTSVPFQSRKDSGDDESSIKQAPMALPKATIPKLSRNQSTSTFNQSIIDVQKRLKKVVRPCYSAHVPYNRSAAPFAYMRLVPCELCKRKWVAETILSTTEPHPSLPIKGTGQLLEARTIRARKPAAGEVDAVKISDVLPFVEYELQRQIMLKLKIYGMNAAYGYTSRFQVGKNCVIATATCTAVYVTALPPPPQMTVSRGAADATPAFLSLQKNIEILIDVNTPTCLSYIYPYHVAPYFHFLLVA